MSYQLPNFDDLTADDIVKRYRFGLDQILAEKYPHVKIRERESEILTRCLARSYAEKWDLYAAGDSPFRFFWMNKHANKDVYSLDQLDAYGYFHTWSDYGGLPLDREDSCAIGLLYPVKRPDWNQTKGWYSIYVAWWDSSKISVPDFPWTMPDSLRDQELEYADFYLEGREQYEKWIANPDHYTRNIEGPWVVRDLENRVKNGIQLTAWQQSIVDAQGWPIKPPFVPPLAPAEKYHDLIVKVTAYASEVHHGQLHVDRWKRVLTALGASQPGYAPMAADEAREYLHRGWERWREPLKALREIENG